MAKMKKKDLKALTQEELGKKLKELRAELSKEMAKKAVGGTPTKASRIRDLKRMIARILTFSNQKSGEVS